MSLSPGWLMGCCLLEIVRIEMKKTLIALGAFVGLVTACGGGGGSNTVGGSSTQVASSLSFDLRSAYVQYYVTPSVHKSSIVGTAGSDSIIGSSTITNGAPTEGTFEGLQAFQRTSTTTGSTIINGKNTYPLDSTMVTWVDTNYQPLGFSATNHIVIDGTAALPNNIRVGDTGTLYTAKIFSDKTKATFLGTLTSTYVVEADTSITAFVSQINTLRDTSGKVTSTESTQFRITKENKISPIKQTQTDYTTGLSATATVE